MDARVIVMLLLVLPIACLGAEDCTDKPECWPEGSAMHTGLQRRAAADALGTELQRRHDELVALISTEIVNAEYLDDQRLIDAIEKQQQAWEQFKGAECELIGSLSTGISTWQSATAVQCEVNLTYQRLRRLRDAVNCVKKIAPEKRRFEQQRCLYQLAPLAVPLEQ